MWLGKKVRDGLMKLVVRIADVGRARQALQGVASGCHEGGG